MQTVTTRLLATAYALVALAAGTMAAPPFAMAAMAAKAAPFAAMAEPQLFPRPTSASWAGAGTRIVFTNLTFQVPTGATVLAAAATRYHAIIFRGRSEEPRLVGWLVGWL